ncbi:MAG: cytochrome c oxidase subunit II [Proteobacteria bacterium]|nr:cytochrome c oxidase subunit II [Pseudomonadota bacterium]
MEKRIPTVLVSLLLIGTIALSFSLSTAAEVKTFDVKAKKYEFDPDTITVNKGDTVIIKAIAIDRDHGFGIKAFNIKKTLPEGKPVTIQFIADKQGEFTIRCTKFCGWRHFWMKGKLIVK